ncbi:MULTISPECIES: cytochrome P450 [unclassified Bradyrhizobium]|uniref:cytochrome P450 n=1 Tax=unclassified Bradyrhizobium TaxID=2631580 RepID=UPI001BA9B5EB|nr:MULTISPECIES: cytochrome P450 [unclassified Bradyrhizobium]MBR1205217.1 cytochrome P450 [Bradyrhizobium sp. AUGA SZCCT0124]MBR1312296.1 cytochrome P450 [Bradyrhizobium sp. AUGA SZCCT0051]MBR1342187.1 cytochrome P450 [Bradyrhizobium sp. AUGA SZCCT0105]MBR1358978.1 cytochrome P450 [Bradyrhizobium sp. AUGA SZCCT0045]
MGTTTTGDLDIPANIAETLVDPVAYADDRIHDSYRWLRANNPLGIARPDRFDPFWVVTKHAHIQAISRQNELFHNADRPTTLTTQALEERVRKITGGPNLVRSLVQMDAPDHPKYRALTQGWFMPANLGKFEGRVREIARATVQRMLDRGGACDFVEDVALGYPLHVIMEILGVPEADEPRMLKLTQELFGPQDPDTARVREALSAEQVSAMLQAIVADFSAYFRKITENRRQNPRDDLATVIANAKIGGDYMPEHDQTSYYMIVATAGHDTTSSSTAGAIWALARDPAEFAKVKANPELIPGLVDEAIRWMTPVKHFMRSATADTELGGRKIAKGDWLMLCYASGNRDEEVFADPDRFRSDRKPNRHVAFGYGAHLCLGQYLAKLEMRILFEELLPHLKSLSLDGEVKMTQAYFVNGPKKLPIRFEVN